MTAYPAHSIAGLDPFKPDSLVDNGFYPGTHSLWSEDRQHRYFLRRPALTAEERAKKPVAFVMLNPSTADEVKDDPTVAKSRRYAKSWGFGEVIVLNAFAYRATDPKNMRAHPDPVGPDNDEVIHATVAHIIEREGIIVCGWGNHGLHLDRGAALRSLLKPFPLHAFPITKQNQPGHPLYLRSTVTPMEWLKAGEE